MVPKRFSFEYAQRWLNLMDAFENQARAMDLFGSFSLMAASSILVIPYERLRPSAHPMHEQEVEPEVSRALKSLSKIGFLDAPFWRDAPASSWRYSRIVKNANVAHAWRDADENHPLSKEATNELGKKSADQIVRLMRNALAHGNVLYLNKDGTEDGGRVESLAFLSRYEETEAQRASAETYRLLVVPEDGFLPFLRAWAAWLQTFGVDCDVYDAGGVVEGANSHGMSAS